MVSKTTEGLRGLNTVLRNLSREVSKIEGRTLKGLIRGAIIIKRSMYTVAPTVPIDEGNLRGGFFIVTSTGNAKEGKEGKFQGADASKLSADHAAVIDLAIARAKKSGMPSVVLGFSAYYGVYVHENVGVNFTKEGSGAKFFISAVDRTADEVLQVIYEEARIKK